LALDANCRAYVNDDSEVYVITKDCSADKPEGYLMIPVKAVTGVDDAQIFSPAFANIWEDAWLWSQKYPGGPASRTALAINSKSGRSQNQLHIHIACVLPQVSALLKSKAIAFYPAPATALALGPDKNVYKAVKVTTLTDENNPFKVAQALTQNAEYYVLTTTSSGTGRGGHAEELLDQTCAASALEPKP
jgi:CDP-diacylglycerol pyrophosphatase